MLIARLHRRIRTLSPRARFALVLSASGLTLLLSESGCSSDSSSTSEKLEPPQLFIVGAQNAGGARFDRDDNIVQIACDPRITLNLGPSTDELGLLDNWSFRAPRACGNIKQCGFVQIELLDSDEKVLHRLNQASLNPVIDSSQVTLDAVRQVVVTLFDGTLGTPFLVDEAPVVDSWKVSFASETGCQMGGAGGGGGMPGLGGEDAIGGFGGSD